MINENSVKSIVFDSARSSSNSLGMRQFNFPANKLPKDGYYKVTSVFVKGSLPTSSYLQVSSPELGDLNQTLCDNNVTDFISQTLAIIPNQASYVENRLGLHLYQNMANNIITLGIMNDANQVITNEFCIVIDFRPKI
jgi:hypothetical protein